MRPVSSNFDLLSAEDLARMFTKSTATISRWAKKESVAAAHPSWRS